MDTLPTYLSRERLSCLFSWSCCFLFFSCECIVSLLGTLMTYVGLYFERNNPSLCRDRNSNVPVKRSFQYPGRLHKDQLSKKGRSNEVMNSMRMLWRRVRQASSSAAVTPPPSSHSSPREATTNTNTIVATVGNPLLRTLLSPKASFATS